MRDKQNRGKRKNKDIKVVVKFTEGYEKRFTKACLDVLKKRDALGGGCNPGSSGRSESPRHH